jgi:hypothetical protein
MLSKQRTELLAVVDDQNFFHRSTIDPVLRRRLEMYTFPHYTAYAVLRQPATMPLLPVIKTKQFLMLV